MAGCCTRNTPSRNTSPQHRESPRETNLELHVRQIIFAMQYHSPDEELLMAVMKDLILTRWPAGMFRTVAALLTPFTGCPLCDTVDALAQMGAVKVEYQDLETAVDNLKEALLASGRLSTKTKLEAWLVCQSLGFIWSGKTKVVYK